MSSASLFCKRLSLQNSDIRECISSFKMIDLSAVLTNCQTGPFNTTERIHLFQEAWSTKPFVFFRWSSLVIRQVHLSRQDMSDSSDMWFKRTCFKTISNFDFVHCTPRSFSERRKSKCYSCHNQPEKKFRFCRQPRFCRYCLFGKSSLKLDFILWLIWNIKSQLFGETAHIDVFKHISWFGKSFKNKHLRKY